MSPVVKAPLYRRCAAEAIGTALLLAAIVGSGTMAERLAAGDPAWVLAAVSLATGAAVFALTCAFHSVSGAHFNPALSFAAVLVRELEWREAGLYALAQIVGALIGMAAAHAVFGDPLLVVSARGLTEVAIARSELIASAGLVVVAIGCGRGASRNMPFAIAGYLMAAYWFAGSISLANPAIALARAAMHVPADFPVAAVVSALGAQFFGAAIAVGAMRAVFGQSRASQGPGDA